MSVAALSTCSPGALPAQSFWRILRGARGAFVLIGLRQNASQQRKFAPVASGSLLHPPAYRQRINYGVSRLRAGKIPVSPAIGISPAAPTVRHPRGERASAMCIRNSVRARRQPMKKLNLIAPGIAASLALCVTPTFGYRPKPLPTSIGVQSQQQPSQPQQPNQPPSQQPQPPNKRRPQPPNPPQPTPQQPLPPQNQRPKQPLPPPNQEPQQPIPPPTEQPRRPNPEQPTPPQTQRPQPEPPQPNPHNPDQPRLPGQQPPNQPPQPRQPQREPPQPNPQNPDQPRLPGQQPPSGTLPQQPPEI